jgi:alkaline phosphatase D
MRRSFLVLFALAASMLAVPATSLAASADFTHGVASGDVTQNSAVLWTRAVPIGPAVNVTVDVWLEEECLTGQKVFKSKVKKPLAENDYTVKIDAVGLQQGNSPHGFDAGTEYCYRFRRGGEAFSPVGHFKTAPAADSAADVKAVYDGDQDSTGGSPGPFHGPFTALGQANLANGDFYVANGDNIYSDSHHRGAPAVTLDEYRDTYKEALTFTDLTDIRAARSQYALMDDHEVQNDYDGQTVSPARYAAGREAFLEYMPVRETGLLHDPSCAGDPLYRTVKWGSDVEVFVLDTRSCRSSDVEAQCSGDLGPTLPPAIRQAFPFNLFLAPTVSPACTAAINDPTRTVLGPVQKAAFKNDLLNSDAKFKLIQNEYSIMQWHARPYDRWEGYAAERSEIIDFIGNNNLHNVTTSNMVFMTTDHHATMQNEVFKDRFTAPATRGEEFVTGPVATDTLQAETVAQFGPLALAALQAIMNLDGMNCRHLDQQSWGEVAYNSTTTQATVTSWKDTGGVVQDFSTSAPCTRTLG